MKPTVRILIAAAACLSLASLAHAATASGAAEPPAAVSAPDAVVTSAAGPAGGPIVENPGPVCSGLKIPCAAADFDGTGAIGPNDLALWLNAFFTLSLDPAYDLDGNGSLGVADLSIWICLFFGC